MPLIEDSGDCGDCGTSCRPFNDEDWRALLPGACRLARMVLPYVCRLHEQFVSRGRIHIVMPNLVVGMDDHDSYMTVYAVLVIMMAISINANDTRWLENPELMATLRGFGCPDLVPYEPIGRNRWTEQCMRAQEKVNAVSFECLEDRMDFRERVFVAVEGSTGVGCSNMVRIARLIDGHDVQIIKDVFYMVSGMTTHGDGNCMVDPQEKSSRTDRMSIKAGEELSGAVTCPTMSGPGCSVGACSHSTGLVPVVGQGR